MSKCVTGVNDLLTCFPDIAKEWDYDKNGDLFPQFVAKSSNKKAWWVCQKCGESYMAKVESRTYGNTNCPKCASSSYYVWAGHNDLESKYPKIASEWDYTANYPLTPKDVRYGSGRSVGWVCKYGHKWNERICQRTSGNRDCPYCCKRLQTSFPEQSVYWYIKHYYPDAISRYTGSWLGRQELDIFIPSIKTAIEYDGWRWHNNDKSKTRDDKKDTLCASQNIKLIRVKEYRKNTNIDNSDDIYVIDGDPTSLSVAILSILSILGAEGPYDIDVQRDCLSIKEQYFHTISNSLLDECPDILDVWDFYKNGNLHPSMFTRRSGFYAWFVCPKCGRSFRRQINKINRQEGLRLLCYSCSHSLCNKKRRRVCRIDDCGNILKFDSISDALRYIGKNPSDAGAISKACRKNIKRYGYHWRYEDDKCEW